MVNMDKTLANRAINFPKVEAAAATSHTLQLLA
jgi:hypothetical protein